MLLKFSTNPLHPKLHGIHHKLMELIFYLYNEIHNKLQYERQFHFRTVINILLDSIR